MVPVLQPLLHIDTEPLVHGLLNLTVGQCSEEAQRLLLCSGAVRDENNSPVASSSSSSSNSSSCSCSCSSSQEEAPSRSPVGSNVEDQHSTLETTLHCGHPPPVPIPAEQDLPPGAGGGDSGRSLCPGPKSQPLCSWLGQGLLTRETLVSHKEEGPWAPGLCPALQKATLPAVLRRFLQPFSQIRGNKCLFP